MHNRPITYYSQYSGVCVVHVYRRVCVRAINVTWLNAVTVEIHRIHLMINRLNLAPTTTPFNVRA